MINSNAFQSAIQKAASILAEQIRINLVAGNFPTGNDEYNANYKPIQDTIKIKTPQQSGKGISITIELGGEDAPYAKAFEFGSGEHDELGSPGKYKIEPKNASALAFEWSPEFIPWGSKKFIGLSGNKFLFRFVEHPGIESRPYIRPAIEAKKQEILKILGQEVKAAILFGKNRVEVIK